MRSISGEKGGWREYIEAFHSDRPGITEAVLGDARASDGTTPYQWTTSALPDDATVLDLACGSGPLLVAASPGRFVGLDRTAAELVGAQRSVGAPLVRGDAGSLPFESGAFSAVACSMALMVVDSPQEVLGEVHRVLARTGVAVFLLPGSLPLTPRDTARYAHLMVALRTPRPAYPNSIHVHGLRRSLSGAGFAVRDDSRRRFSYFLGDVKATRLFVESLYTPGSPSDRIEAALRVASRWVGSDIGIPLRRIVCDSQV